MIADQALKDFARKLVELSLGNDGRLSDERVQGVLQVLRERPPSNLKPTFHFLHIKVLKLYLYYVKQEIRNSEAVVEHAGRISSEIFESIEQMLSTRYGRVITSQRRENPNLIAGIRVSIADDVFESSIAGNLTGLSGKAE